MRSALAAATAALLLAPFALCQVTIPPHSSSYTGYSRGFNFTSGTTFLITQLGLPLDAYVAGDTAGYMVRINGVEVLRSVGNAGTIATSILVNLGDVVDVIGNWSPVATTNFTAHNSYGSGSFATLIEGVPHTLQRTGWQWDIGDPGYLGGSYLAPTTGDLGRVLLYTSPPIGLFPNFNATPRSGTSPLLVQFTDMTFSSDPGGIVAWQWDFDGDTVIDSTLQNPSFTYTACGDFAVSLTAVDSSHGAVTMSKPGYVSVDPISADFTATPTSGPTPLIVQFTDASSNATGWAWDFDNDNVVDSTLQNPIWAYATPGAYTVRLAVTNACRSASVTKPDAIQAGAIIVPAAAQTTEGNSSNTYPFDLASASRVQFVHDASNFTAQGINTPVLITRLRLRANSATTTWTGDTIASLRIDLSTAPVDFLAMSSTFASNVGTDVVTVYNAPLVIPPGSSTLGTLGPWYIDIPLSTPFVYDPALGDLTIDYLSSGVPAVANTPTPDAVTTAGVALAKRVYTTTPTNPTGTLTSGELANVMAIGLTPAAGLFPAFTATPTTGASPLLVQFTDQSYSSDPGGVVAWQWDFDGDSIVDSTLQSPAFSYTGCGTYSVSLTVIDTTHGPQTLTKPNLITTDPLVAGFTVQALGGGTFQFTDTSAPTPQAWAWDFDGDSVIDSTLQNPTHTYPPTCAINNVLLTAILNCRTGTASDQLFVAPASATTQLSGATGTTSSTGVGNIFDIVVNAQDGISVCAFTTISYTGTGPFRVDVYVTDGSYVGKDTNLASWRLVATGTGVMGGGTTTAPAVNTVTLANPFYLPAGSYGIALVNYALSGAAYVGYTAVATGPFGNADLTICPNPATAPSIARTSLFGGTLYTPRLWNGSFHYTKLSLSNTGGYGFFAPGCAGTLPVARLTANTPPALNSTLQVTATNLPANVALMLFGFSRTTSAFGALPIDLGIVGAAGCALRVSNDGQFVLIGSGNTATWVAPIPNIAALLGMQFYNQAFAIDGAANAFGAVASDAAGAVLGR